MVKNFYSKKNHVYLNMDSNYVVKEFLDQEAFTREVKIYEILKTTGFKDIPELIEKDREKKTLILSYINSKTALAMIEEYELVNNSSQVLDLILSIKGWLERFYRALDESPMVSPKGQWCFGDVNLRNFMIKGPIVGLDFENVGLGNRDLEWIELLGRFLIYRPEKSPFKYQVLRELYERLGHKDLSYTQWMDLIEDQAEIITKKRISYRHQTDDLIS